eukprot:CCRYP_017819-RA/>CCRYP_017819-RA protein AED:0.41 eAED:0.41 QI:0/-1/0/1/-1/1/1/0/194
MSGVTCAQTGQTGRQGRQRNVSQDKCFNCGSLGHHAKDCIKDGNQEAEKSGADFFIVEDEALALEEDLEGMVLQEGADFFSMVKGVGFLEVNRDRMTRTKCNRNKAYLDTCCTNHSCFAAEHLKNIHTTGVVLKQHCNEGTKGIKFWYNEEGIVNLVSVPELELDSFVLEYMIKDGWMAHGPDGKTIMFKQDSG